MFGGDVLARVVKAGDFHLVVHGVRRGVNAGRIWGFRTPGDGGSVGGGAGNGLNGDVARYGKAIRQVKGGADDVLHHGAGTQSHAGAGGLDVLRYGLEDLVQLAGIGGSHIVLASAHKRFLVELSMATITVLCAGLGGNIFATPAGTPSWGTIPIKKANFNFPVLVKVI